MPIAPIKAGGWSQGQPLTPAHLNDFQAKLIGAGDDIDRITHRQLPALLLPRLLEATFAVTNETLAVINPDGEGKPTLVMRSGADGVVEVLDTPIAVVKGTLSEAVAGGAVSAAYSSTLQRVVLVPTTNASSTKCANYTDNRGTTWFVGGDMGFLAEQVVWNPTHARFICRGPTTQVSHSPDADISPGWTVTTHSLSTSGLGGMAVLSGGRTVICGRDGSDFPRMSISDNGGTSWSDSGGYPAPPSGSWLNEGYITGNGGSKIWHAGFISGALRVSTSPDGVTWTPIADLTTADNNMPPALLQPSAAIVPKLMCCPNTGLLVLIGARTTDGSFAIASVDEGLSWSAPIFFPAGTLHGYGVASGRLFYAKGTRTMASDGFSGF